MKRQTKNPRKLAANSAKQSTSSTSLSARPSTSSAFTINQQQIPQFKFAAKKHGKEGQLSKIKANFASLVLKNKLVYHYTIEIKGRDRIQNEADSKINNRIRLRQQKRNEKIVRGSNYEIFRRLVQENPDTFKSEPAFDCKQNVYSSTEIVLEGDRKEFAFRIRVTEKKFLQTFDITLYKPNPNIIDLSKLNYNDILARGDRGKINFDLGNLKDGRFGHYSKAKLSENGLQLCVDRVACVFNKSGNMLEIIRQFCTESRNRFRGRNNQQSVEINHNFGLSSEELAELNRELKGLDFEGKKLLSS